MAHADLDPLLDATLGFARQMLEKHAEFFPFAASMKADGSIALVGAQTESERPGSQELIDLLAAGLRAQAASREIRASAICYDVRIRPQGGSPPTDAVCVSLDHVSGESVDVFLPYRHRRFRRPTYGQISAGPCSIRIFDAAESDA